MTSSRYWMLLAAGIVIVFGAVIVMHAPEDVPPVAVADIAAPVAEPAPPAPAPAAVPVVATRSQPASVPAAAPASATAAPRHLMSATETRFHEATDYLAFARELLPRAREGDADAQFHLHAALDYCRRSYRAYFDRGQERRSLADAVRAEGATPSTEREIRQAHSRCDGLMNLDTGEIGEGEQWLQRAARGGHPRAQVVLGAKMIAGSRFLSAEQAARTQAEARQMLRQSLSSRDPAVIWAAGALPTDRRESQAWWRAACDQGLDCGPGSPSVRQLCRDVPDCQPFESVEDILVRTADNPATLTERAREINSLIAAGNWRALGLAEPAATP